MSGETLGKHAKVLQSMCQQHAGSGCLAGIEMFKGLGRRDLAPKTCFKARSVEFNKKKSTRSEIKAQMHSLLLSVILETR